MANSSKQWQTVTKCANIGKQWQIFVTYSLRLGKVRLGKYILVVISFLLKFRQCTYYLNDHLAQPHYLRRPCSGHPCHFCDPSTLHPGCLNPSSPPQFICHSPPGRHHCPYARWHCQKLYTGYILNMYSICREYVADILVT